jgi:transcriptional regulator with XRE-family HTH domain
MQIFAANLARLLAMGGRYGLPTSQAELARRSGVSQKTLSNWLAPDRGVAPQLDKLEPIARVYGLEVWQLLVPDLPDDMVMAGPLQKLVANYRKISSPRAREYIDRVAEAEAHYHPGTRRDPDDR